MYYNAKGGVEAAGAETLSDELSEKALEEGWILVRWWVFFSNITSKH